MEVKLKQCFMIFAATVIVTLLFLTLLHPETASLTGMWHVPVEPLRPTDSYDMASLETLYEQRRENARMECRNHPVKSPGLEKNIYTRNMYYDPKTNSLYCAVPKIGSSTWKRLFLVLHSNKTKDPFAISGLDIHVSYKLAQFSVGQIPKDKRAEIAEQAFTFMFARNPFHRIFSAYCDKIFMLAFETSKMVQYIRKQLATNATAEDGVFVYTGREYNVTFAEALAHAAGTQDQHFVSIYKQCNPCEIDYRVLGRMESLDTDSRYVLAKLNRSHVLENTMEDDAFKDSRDQGTIRELVERVFKVLQHRPNGTSKFKALVRTWKIFHIRGLVRDDIQYPLSVTETKKATAFCISQLAIQAMSLSGKRAERLAQRDKYYRQAFRSVPLAGILQFSMSVRSDCRLFGYDCYPAEIFHGRRDGDEEDNVFSNDKYLYEGLL